ncbi:hypothetical protein K7X08_016399 [Anisodus acutangulus]|uniref:Uncharacterized protein n=1 Tax=Anisodus acutangulus TaxID=402998 RepID=A0A9Q1LE39_9SOLA|nr:hypothetical protein K7X08_016399 [Anisodus acutangulus]
MRQRDILEFRTPQHPSLGRNNWGGASPLLARNVPKESLDQRYARLNTIRTRDEVFLELESDNFLNMLNAEASKYEAPATSVRQGKFWKLIWRPRRKLNIVRPASSSSSSSLGTGSKKKKYFKRLDPKNKWPNGWC